MTGAAMIGGVRAFRVQDASAVARSRIPPVQSRKCWLDSDACSRSRQRPYCDDEHAECGVPGLIGTPLLTILLALDFIKTVSGILNDVVSAMALLRSLIYLLARPQLDRVLLSLPSGAASMTAVGITLSSSGGDGDRAMQNRSELS